MPQRHNPNADDPLGWRARFALSDIARCELISRGAFSTEGFSEAVGGVVRAISRLIGTTMSFVSAVIVRLISRHRSYRNRLDVQLKHISAMSNPQLNRNDRAAVLSWNEFVVLRRKFNRALAYLENGGRGGLPSLPTSPPKPIREYLSVLGWNTSNAAEVIGFADRNLLNGDLRRIERIPTTLERIWRARGTTMNPEELHNLRTATSAMVETYYQLARHAIRISLHFTDKPQSAFGTGDL